MLITPEKFSYLTGIVIDNFEGGYYHPRMLSAMSPASRKLLSASGETMYGLDRKAGSELSKYPEWDSFWNEMDKAAAYANWGHYYMGGKLEPKLKELAGKIMFRWFSELHSRYIDTNSDAVIAADDRLIIHFAYACWNGESWFKKYAASLSKAITKYLGLREAIFEEAIKARTQASNILGIPNKAIRQQGAKMIQLFITLRLN